MVLAIAALFVHLHAVAAVSDTVSPQPAVVSASSTASNTETRSSSPVPVAKAQRTQEKLLASNTGFAATGLDSMSSQTSSGTPLSASNFASVIRGSDSLSAIRVATPGAKALRFIEPESLPSRRKWLALAAAEHAAAAFDAYSTRRAVNLGAVEADPMMRPFAQSPAIYAAIQVAPVALDFAARRMQRSQNGFLRRTWWLPQSAAAGMFLFSGVHNLHVANQLH